MKKCENYETILPFSCCPLIFLWFSLGNQRNPLNLYIGTERTTTAADVWQDSALFSPPGNRAIFCTFWGHFLTELHSKPGEKSKNIHWRKILKIQWRRRPEIADFCPLSWSNMSRLQSLTKLSRMSTKWSESLFFTVWALEDLLLKIWDSRILMDIFKRPLWQKTPFSDLNFRSQLSALPWLLSFKEDFLFFCAQEVVNWEKVKGRQGRGSHDCFTPKKRTNQDQKRQVGKQKKKLFILATFVYLYLGSFLLTIELLCLQVFWGTSLLTIGAPLLAMAASQLTVRASRF